MRIIIVEDEAVTRRWVRKKIEELDINYHVTGEFVNGKQALEYCREHEVEVVFTDIRMAVMDGLEFLDRLKNERIAQPYKVILSAYDEFHYARQAIKAGANEFILKPEITKEGMKTTLEEAKRFLEKSRTRDSKAACGSEPERRRITMEKLLETGTTGQQREEVLRGLENRGIALKEEGIVLLSISLSGEEKGDAALEVAELFMQEEHISGICASIEEGEYLLLYNPSLHMDREVFSGKLEALLRHNLGTEVYIGISVKKDGFHHLRDMLRQARMARENRTFFRLPGIWRYDAMTVNSDSGHGDLYYAVEMREILAAVEKNDFESAEEKMKGILEDIEGRIVLPPAYVKVLCIEILSSCIQKARTYALTAAEEEEVRRTEMMFCERFRTLQDLKNWTYAGMAELRRICEIKSSLNQYSGPVRDIIGYVKQNYTQKISLEQVSSLVHLNKSYVSVLFKKETGEKFSDFLLRVRLEESRRLLGATRKSIQEIAGMAGFPDAAYFSRAFKERYGKSPMEYRKGI